MVSQKFSGKEEDKLRDRTNNNNGILSHQSSPVQDEMTVNKAISGKKKVPSLNVSSVVKMTRCDKENKVESKPDKQAVIEDEQDITIVTDAAMVLSD